MVAAHKNKLSDVEAEISRLRSEQMRLQHENFIEQLQPKVNASIGKTFVYRNNNTGGEDRWDVFRKLKAVEWTEYHGWAIYEECQLRMDNGTPGITIYVDLLSSEDVFPRPELGWKECDPSEFEGCYARCLAELADPKLARAKVFKV